MLFNTRKETRVKFKLAGFSCISFLSHDETKQKEQTKQERYCLGLLSMVKFQATQLFSGEMPDFWTTSQSTGILLTSSTNHCMVVLFFSALDISTQ